MAFGARSTRGGPLSVRTTLSLFIISSAFVAAVGAFQADGDEDLSSLGEATEAFGEASYETAAAELREAGPTSHLSDLPSLPAAFDAIDSAALDIHSDARARAEDALVAMLTAGLPREAERSSLLGADSASETPASMLEDFELALAFESSARAELAFAGGFGAQSRLDLDEPSSTAAADQRVVKGAIAKGQSLSTALRSHGIRPSVVHIIASELSPIFDFTRARPGQEYRVVLDESDQLVRFDYHVADATQVQVVRDEHGVYRAKRADVELEPQVVRMAGVVETSLYDAVRALGEDGSLASSFARVFGSQFDFVRNTRRGDEFHVLYERLYRKRRDGRLEYVKPGRILAARYRSGGAEFEAVRFDGPDGELADAGGFYRTDGTSLERQFLSSPIENARVTSGFSNARRHPILHITRPHHGIDLAAPRGTPVVAVGEGTVIHRGWSGGFGNLVKVRHPGGYVSYYSHLQGFAKGLHVGQKVSQKQVVGFVGSTGLATGPHTCFRMEKDGKYLNPRGIDRRAAEPIRGEQWAAFAAQRDERLLGLDGGSVVAVQDAL